MKLIALMLLVPVVAVACPKDTYEYKGDCVLDLKPIAAAPVQASDEKPPTDKMPSYQREGVSLVEAKNMALEDAKADEDKRQADLEGKRSAGIK